LTRQVFSALEKDLTAVLSPHEQTDDYLTHSIGNLALLAHSDNAALNNSVFEVKRREILRLDKEGSYIPACTRNVFLKYYTTEGDQQLHFWSAADRDAYLSAIESELAPYLTAEAVSA